MSKYVEFLSMVSSEFHRYLIENEEAANKMPFNALVIFEIEGEENFNKWHKAMSLRNRESNQPVVHICVKKWREHSLIEKLSLLEMAV